MFGFSRHIGAALLVACMVGGAPAAAQQNLPLRAQESYSHPHSGIEVPASLGGYPRTTARAYAEDHLDVGMNFESPDRGEVLSFYVFRNTNGSVPVWFSQAQAAIESQSGLDNPAVAVAPESFSLSGSEVSSALRAVYAPGRRSVMRSTGVVLFTVNGFYVKIRASSASRSPTELVTWMDAAMLELVLPEITGEAVAPIEDCADELRFRGRSRDTETNPVGSLFGSLVVSGLEADQEEIDEGASVSSTTTWCREDELQPTQIVYRADASEDSYLIAIGDNGNAIAVGPDGLGALLSEDDDEEVFSPRLIMADQTLNLVTQDRLPRPSRVMELLMEERFIGSVATWGEDRAITIDTGAF